MREILFRGRRIDNGEWVEGDLIHSEGRTYCGIFAETLAQVDPSTVGQYTELKDKNGEWIFEGDIVECWSEGVNAKGTVRQRKDGMWIIYPAWQETIMWSLCPDEHCNTTVTVIGNIHDNPEIAEGAK